MLKRFSTPKHKEITGRLDKHSLVGTLSSLIEDILGDFSDFSRKLSAHSFLFLKHEIQTLVNLTAACLVKNEIL